MGSGASDRLIVDRDHDNVLWCAAWPCDLEPQIEERCL